MGRYSRPTDRGGKLERILRIEKIGRIRRLLDRPGQPTRAWQTLEETDLAPGLSRFHFRLDASQSGACGAGWGPPTLHGGHAAAPTLGVGVSEAPAQGFVDGGGRGHGGRFGGRSRCFHAGSDSKAADSKNSELCRLCNPAPRAVELTDGPCPCRRPAAASERQPSSIVSARQGSRGKEATETPSRKLH